MGRICGGVGSQRPLWLSHHSYPGFDPSVYRQRPVVMETCQDDRGQGTGAEEETKTTREHCQSQESQEGLSLAWRGVNIKVWSPICGSSLNPGQF
ncbi:hypothetical protein QQF64_032422 [Cirrhinus molitorella]|uniref:Uncharacterized protein n=1 Tax=Cirrhinus molitorella TaxID=172907 RepID=A0ABR3MZT1_9TELE